MVIYGATMLVFANLAGWLAERQPLRKPTFLCGLAFNFGGTLMFALSSHPYMLAIARGLQGASTGTVFTPVLSYMATGIGREELGKWIGIVFTGLTAGLTISPLLAGIIYAKAGYLAVFALALAVIAITFIFAVLCVSPKRGQTIISKGEIGRQENYGTVHRTTTSQPERTAPPETSTREIDVRDDGDDEARLLIAQSPSTSKKNDSFWIRNLPSALILLGSPRVLAAVYGELVQVGMLSAFDSILPLFVERTFNWDSLASGILFLTIALPAVFGGAAGALSDRLGARVVAMTGFILVTIAIALMSLVTTKSIGQIVLLCVLLVLTGCGSALMLSPLAADISIAAEELEKKHAGIFGPDGPISTAYGLFNSAHAVGLMIGPAFAGAVYDTAGWRVVIWALAGFCASGIPMVFFIGSGRHDPEPATSNTNDDGPS